MYFFPLYELSFKARKDANRASSGEKRNWVILRLRKTIMSFCDCCYFPFWRKDFVKMVEDRQDLHWEKSLRSPVLEDQRERKVILSNKIAVVLRMIEKLWFSFPKIAINSFIARGQWKAGELEWCTLSVFASLLMLAEQKGSCWKAAEKFTKQNWAEQGVNMQDHENIV